MGRAQGGAPAESLFFEAAARLGVDAQAPLLDETGPREVCEAALAFNITQRRIRRLLEDRTRMLAAIAHDLRTPIMRLRLRRTSRRRGATREDGTRSYRDGDDDHGRDWLRA